MNLIERYLQAIGRELPTNKREDILKELRSSLYDALEGEGEPTEERVAAMIQEMGSPREVAASYYPAGQYMIGPVLYPTFLMVVKIVVTVILTVQVLATALSFAVEQNLAQALLREFGDLFTSLPLVVGYVVLIFWGIQRLGVQPESEKPFNPRDLPPLESVAEPVSRFEQIFSIIVNVVVLAALSQFVLAGGFNVAFFDNPVIRQYLPWLVATTVLGIAVDIVLLWRGRWDTTIRIGAILVNLFDLGVLYVVLEGHNAWLRAAGVTESLITMSANPELFFANLQVTGMLMFQFGIAFAIVIVGAETAFYVYKLIRARMNALSTPVVGLVSANR